MFRYISHELWLVSDELVWQLVTEHDPSRSVGVQTSNEPAPVDHHPRPEPVTLMDILRKFQFYKKVFLILKELKKCDFFGKLKIIKTVKFAKDSPNFPKFTKSFQCTGNFYWCQNIHQILFR